MGWLVVFGVGLILSICYWKLVHSPYHPRKDKFHEKNCFITGGSDGLGKAVAIELAKLGANIVICSRSKEKLSLAVQEIQKYTIRDGQEVSYCCADVTCKEQAAKAIEEAELILGGVPDYVITCAGAAKPGFFVEQDWVDFKNGMELNYFGVLNVLKPAAERMVSTQTKGHLVMISSTLGLFGLVGYSQYSPTKFALRGLAECLRQELLPHGIKVSIYFVSTIATSGYAAENQTKPLVTKEIESGDPSNPSPEARARSLIDGIANGQFSISSDILTSIFQATCIGAMPRNSWVLDGILAIVGWAVIPFWRLYADHLTKTYHGRDTAASQSNGTQ